MQGFKAAKTFSILGIPILLVVLLMLSTTERQNECEQPRAKTFAEVLSNNLDADRPGATAIVVRGGQVLYRGAFGLADTRTSQPLGPEMRLRVGSLAKPFTAAAIMLLAEQGKLSLAAHLHEYLADFPKRRITIEQLLVHSSGLADFTDSSAFEDNFSKEVDPKFVIDLFQNQPLLFEPGTKVSYSNSNYFLLGIVIESVTHQPYAEFMKEAIFQPLGMESTSIETSDKDLLAIVPGHTRTQKAEPISPAFTFSAGALVTNVDDLARWNTAINRGLLLGDKGWQRVFTPFKLKDGHETTSCIGWGVHKLHGEKLFAHEGRTYGYSAMMMRFPDKRLFVAVLSNDDRLHLFSLIGSWFHRSDSACLAGQLATLALR